MAKNALVKPFLKWVGGKRQLLPAIQKYIPKKIDLYCEPFVGGGAVFFHIQPKRAIINDLNTELINVYDTIQNDLEALVEDLKTHKNDSDYFYKIRSLDREDNFKSISSVKRASRIVYLNKTCYNGLYRVNNSGEFNAPFGKYKNPNIVNEPILKAVNKYLSSNEIEIFNIDYEKLLTQIPQNSFVYLDPPYYPVSESSNFTGYVQGGWGMHDQVRLKNACDNLNERGVKFLLSNSASDFIKDLYSGYEINVVKATRAINSNADKRGEVDEVLIKNYE